MNNRFTRVAILTKADAVAAIAVDTNVTTENHGLVHLTSSFDSRCGQKPHFHQTHPDPASARESFKESVAVSRDRGWTVAYHGERNNG